MLSLKCFRSIFKSNKNQETRRRMPYIDYITICTKIFNKSLKSKLKDNLMMLFYYCLFFITIYLLTNYHNKYYH